ncbi:MAG: IMPACT family protein [Sulfobacillus sp.]
MAQTLVAIVGEGRAEISVSRSRFIGLARPAADATGAEEAVGKIRLAFPDASHHSFAWRAGAGQERLSDDGEPQGTAGPPLLETLRRAGVDFGVVAVVRYYGGRNLGRPGLYRAYLEAAKAALSAAALADLVPGCSYQISLPHHRRPTLMRELASVRGEVSETVWADSVEITYWLPEEGQARRCLEDRMPEATAARLIGPQVHQRAHQR